MNLRTAFDSVNRKALGEALEQRGVNRELRCRLGEIYEEIISRVRVEGIEMGQSFRTARGVRQGCPLSPSLFSLLIADPEEKMRKRGMGGIEIEGRKLYTLSYADDVVLIAREGEGLKLMMKELEGYLKEKGLEANPRKSKVMRFGRRLRKIRKERV